MNGLKTLFICLTLAIVCKLTISIISGVQKQKAKKVAKTEITTTKTKK